MPDEYINPPAGDAPLTIILRYAAYTWRKSMTVRSAHMPTPELLEQAAKEIERLRTALEKIADWDSNWGPFPENNEAWRAMVVVTAREAVPESKR